jgi:hypothetical protein
MSTARPHQLQLVVEARRGVGDRIVLRCGHPDCRVRMEWASTEVVEVAEEFGLTREHFLETLVRRGSRRAFHWAVRQAGSAAFGCRVTASNEPVPSPGPDGTGNEAVSGHLGADDT